MLPLNRSLHARPHRHGLFPALQQGCHSSHRHHLDLPSPSHGLGGGLRLLLRELLEFAERSLRFNSLTSLRSLEQYVYHRTTHEVDSLWNIHQHHHTTKHPTAILSILAEDRQEYLEVLLIPLAASLMVPMSFSEMYITLCYTIVRRPSLSLLSLLVR